MKYPKHIISCILAANIALSISIPAFAADNNSINDIYDTDTTYSEMEIGDTTTEMLLNREEIDTMSQQEIMNFLLGATSLTTEEALQLSNYLKSSDYANGISTTYGIYDHAEWAIKPHITSSKNIAYATEKWISLDAYNSSTAISFSSQRSLTVSVSLSYEGSSEIQKFKGLKGSGHVSFTTTKNTSITANPWTYVAWRPYIVYREDVWEGRMRIKTVIPNPTGVYENTWYDNHTGKNRTKVTSSTQMWDKVNKAHKKNSPTPVPPIAPPQVQQP